MPLAKKGPTFCFSRSADRTETVCAWDSGPPSLGMLVGVATAGGLALLGILTAGFLLLRNRNKGPGGRVPLDFFKGSMRSMTSWQKRHKVLTHGNLCPSYRTSTLGLLQEPLPSPFSLPDALAPDFSRVMRMARRPSGVTIPST
jgi:hypothetical protein